MEMEDVDQEKSKLSVSLAFWVLYILQSVYITVQRQAILYSAFIKYWWCFLESGMSLSSDLNMGANQSAHVISQICYNFYKNPNVTTMSVFDGKQNIIFLEILCMMETNTTKHFL